jgi:UDP-glucose 4-epimerase
MLNNKTILVTGGAGFIGSYLCERLVQNKDNDVYSLDNYFTGSETKHVDNVTERSGYVSHSNALFLAQNHQLIALGIFFGKIE